MSTNLQTGQFYGATQKRVDAAGLVLTEIRHTQGRKLPMHTHESAYFGLLLDGGYTEWFTQRATEYGPFTLGFHPPSLTHEDEIPACGSRMFCIEVREAFWQGTRNLLTVPKFTPDLCGRETTWLGVKLYRAFRAGTLDALQIEEICGEMLQGCARANFTEEKSAPGWLDMVTDLLRGKFRTQITLDAIAQELNVHPIHLSRVFRKKHRCSMGEYVNRLRVQFACAKMSQGWPALDELALEAGFADQSHMGRVFKSIVGDTPAKFRELLHNSVHTSA
ncbi:MAG: helix-turn-helix transcriptional regulator [Acidobacteria bacterium]|nr:helix-turn-helix transcriptional regulator [Acidobacteriota bacterium]MBS1866518.1 helix-turn-helix transcriptional regulator [Acidobacteriota bacterium]